MTHHPRSTAYTTTPSDSQAFDNSPARSPSRARAMAEQSQAAPCPSAQSTVAQRADADMRQGRCNSLPHGLRRPEQEISGCRWIDGDVGSSHWRYCQGPRLPGRSYCADHYSRSINPNGDEQFQVEQAECERYLSDLPPMDDESWATE